MAKISVIGAGNVGATTVQRLAELELGEIVMTDIVEGLPQGKALDLMQAGAIKGYDTSIIGTNDYAEIVDSDLVIITAGIARKPGMTREDLIKTNSKIIAEVSRNIAKYAPDSVVINVTNPLDIITYIAMKSTGFETKKVFGMSGVLDSGRFASFIAEELKCSKKRCSGNGYRWSWRSDGASSSIYNSVRSSTHGPASRGQNCQAGREDSKRRSRDRRAP